MRFRKKSTELKDKNGNGSGIYLYEQNQARLALQKILTANPSYIARVHSIGLLHKASKNDTFIKNADGLVRLCEQVSQNKIQHAILPHEEAGLFQTRLDGATGVAPETGALPDPLPLDRTAQQLEILAEMQAAMVETFNNYRDTPNDTKTELACSAYAQLVQAEAALRASPKPPRDDTPPAAGRAPVPPAPQ
jgi:HEPN domain-containing protein